MPWLLDTPISSGDLDTSDYDIVKITRMSLNSERNQIDVQWQQGYMDGDEMVRGMAQRDASFHASIEGEEYQTLVTTHLPLDTPTLELTYAAVKRGLYEWLFAKGLIGAGTIIV